MVTRDHDGKTVILTHYNFPCTHPVMENVFAKEIGAFTEIIWLIKGSVETGKIKKWHNSTVFISNNDNFLSKKFNKIIEWQNLLNLLKILFSEKVKIIMVRDLPFEALLIVLLRPLFGFRLYFQYSVPIGDLNIAYHKVVKSKKKYWYFFRGHLQNILTQKVLKIADLVFPITEFHKQELLFFADEEKMVPLTMGVDKEWVARKRRKVELLEELKERGRIVAYFGSFNFIRKPQFILRAFANANSKLSNLYLILMGSMSPIEKDELLEVCHRLGISENVVFTGGLSRNDLQDHLAYCDISLCLVPPEKYYKISSPTKLYESLANGVPVIANKGIDEQEKAVSAAILELINDRETIKRMKKCGMEYVINNYEYKVVAQKIIKFFE